MSTEHMTQFDISAAEIFNESAGRIAQSFEDIHGDLTEILKTAGTYGHEGYDFDGDGAVVGDLIYLDEPAGKKTYNWFVGWGIRFPTKSEWWLNCTPKLTTKNHVYVYMQNSKKGFEGFSKFVSGAPDGWSVNEDDLEWVAAQELGEFAGDPEYMTAEISKWVGEKIKQLVPVILKVRTSS